VSELNHSFLVCCSYDTSETTCLNIYKKKSQFKLDDYKILKQSVHIVKYFGCGHLVS